MELLHQLLAADNISIANLESEVIALGYDPQNLTDAEAMEVVAKLKTKNGKALAKSNGKGKATKVTKPTASDLNRDSRTDRTPSVNNGLGTSLNHAVGQSLEEVQILQSGVRAAKDKIVSTKANELMDEIADIPNATLLEFSRLAAQHTNNPAFFQQRTDEITDSILTAFGITQT